MVDKVQRVRISDCMILLMKIKLNPCILEFADLTVKDVAHGRLQTQKNNVPREILEAPIKVLDFNS